MKYIHIEISDKLSAQIARHAKKTGMFQKRVVELAVIEYLAKHKK